jgi:hypothetical protein
LVIAMLKEPLYVPVESPSGFTCTEIVSFSVAIVPADRRYCKS